MFRSIRSLSPVDVYMFIMSEDKSFENYKFSLLIAEHIHFELLIVFNAARQNLILFTVEQSHMSNQRGAIIYG